MKSYFVLLMLSFFYTGDAFFKCVNKPEYDVEIKWEAAANEQTYVPAPQFTKCFSFQVKALKWVEISFQKEHTKDKSKYIYVDLGYNNEKDSAIVVRNKPYAVTQTPNYLSTKEYRGFWISWYNGYIQVGKENQTEPFMKQKFDKELTYKLIGFRLEYANKDGLFLKIPRCHKCGKMPSFIEWPEPAEPANERILPDYYFMYN